jgi:rare lipoprotein A
MRNYLGASRLVAAALVGASALVWGTLIATAPAAAQSKNYNKVASSRSFSGMASYYGYEAGRKTASGQRMNAAAMTAAHRTLPFGTQVKVTEPRSGRSVVVTINDRGPFIRGRVLDLSTGAAAVIGIKGRGVGRVVAEVM